MWKISGNRLLSYGVRAFNDALGRGLTALLRDPEYTDVYPVSFIHMLVMSLAFDIQLGHGDGAYFFFFYKQCMSCFNQNLLPFLVSE